MDPPPAAAPDCEARIARRPDRCLLRVGDHDGGAATHAGPRGPSRSAPRVIDRGGPLRSRERELGLEYLVDLRWITAEGGGEEARVAAPYDDERRARFLPKRLDRLGEFHDRFGARVVEDTEPRQVDHDADPSFERGEIDGGGAGGRE